MGKIVDYFCLRVIQTRLTLYIVYYNYTELRLGRQGLPEPPLGRVQQSQNTLQVQALQKKYWEEPKYEGKR